MPKFEPKRKRWQKPSRRSHPRLWGWRTSQSSSPCDAVGHGGVYETLRAYRGHVFALPWHLDRLASSLHTMGMARPAHWDLLASAAQQRARRFRRMDATIRIAVMVQDAQTRQTRWLVMARRLTPRPRAWYRDGIHLRTSPAYRYTQATVPPQVKHTDLLPSILGWHDGVRGAAELIYRTADGYVGEGTVSSVCIVTRERALCSTPSTHGVLAGVTCHVLFQLAPEAGLSPQWMPVTRHDVWNADEVFVANSLFEVLPVTRYDGRVIGTGRPGPLTRQLHTAFRAQVQREIRNSKSEARNKCK